MAILNDNFTLRAPVPIDDKLGWWDGSAWQPFLSRQDAIDKTRFYRYRTLTLPVIENGDVVEYWFKMGVEDEDFILKTADLSNYYTKTELQTPGLSFVHFDNITNVPNFLTSVEWDIITGDQSVVNVGGFNNDAGYITSADLPDLSNYIQQGQDNTLLNNAAGYITAADIPVPPAPQTLAFTNGVLSISDGNSVNLDIRYYTQAEVDSLLNGLVPTTRTLTLAPGNGILIPAPTQALNQDRTWDISIDPDYTSFNNYYIISQVDQLIADSLIGYATEQWVQDQNYITSADIPAAQTLTWTAATGTLAISGGNSVILDGRYSLLGHTHPISDITGLQAALDGKEDSFSKGSIIQGSNVTITGTLTGRLVGAGDITIDVTIPPVDLSGYYTKTELQTSGSAQVHWDNLTNVPSYVPTSRTITPGTGLTGGGNLTANRTISFDTTWGDARYAALAHTHPISDIIGLQAALDNKVNTSTTITPGYAMDISGSWISGWGFAVDTDILDARYLRKDINDNNGAFSITLGGLNTETATVQSTLTLESLGVGSVSDNFLTINGSGVVQRTALVLPEFGFDVTVGAQTMSISNDDVWTFVGGGDTTITLNSTTKEITINSIPGSGTGGVLVSFNGRTDPAAIPVSGDYTTNMVPESGNLYFTEARVRATPLTGLTAGPPTSILATDTILQAFGKINPLLDTKAGKSTTITINGTSGNITIGGGNSQDLSTNRTWTINLATAGTAGTYTKVTTDAYGRVISSSSLVAGDIPALAISKISGLQTALDGKESLSNKVTSFTTANNTLYPTTQAVVDYVASQAPSPQTLSLGTSAGSILISGGNAILLNSLATVAATNGEFSDFIDGLPGGGFHPFTSTTGATGFPAPLGAGIVRKRNSGTNTLGTFALWTANSATDELYFNVGSGTSTWNGWRIIADRGWATSNLLSSSDSRIANWTTAFNRSITSFGFNTTNGNLTIGRESGGNWTANLDGRYALPTDIPTNYVTTNTTQTNLSGIKTWTNIHYFKPTNTGTLQQGTIDIGGSTGSAYIRGGQSESATQSFILRAYQQSGVQLELSEGGINAAGNSTFASSVNTPLVKSTTGDLLTFQGENTGLMYLGNDGLSIGNVPSPARASALQVQGNVWATDAYILGITNSPIAEFGLSGTADSFVRNITPTGRLLLMTNDTNRIVIDAAGTVTIPDLSGVGNRMVVASTSGSLSTQAIPTFAAQTLSFTTPGRLSISAGNMVVLSSLSVTQRQDANERLLDTGFTPYVTVAGMTNYPSTVVGTGIRTEKYSSATNQSGFDIYKVASQDILWYKTFEAESTESSWKIIADRDWTSANFIQLADVNQKAEGAKAFTNLRVSTNSNILSSNSWGFTGHGYSGSYSDLTEATMPITLPNYTESFTFAQTNATNWPQLFAKDALGFHHINTKKFWSINSGMQWAYGYRSTATVAQLTGDAPLFRFFSGSPGSETAGEWQTVATVEKTVSNLVGNWRNDSQGNPRWYWGSSADGTSGIILRMSNPTQTFAIRNSANNAIWTVNDSGTLTVGEVPYARITGAPSIPTNYVTTNTTQAVTGIKTWTNRQVWTPSAGLGPFAASIDIGNVGSGAYIRAGQAAAGVQSFILRGYVTSPTSPQLELNEGGINVVTGMITPWTIEGTSLQGRDRAGIYYSTTNPSASAYPMMTFKFDSTINKTFSIGTLGSTTGNPSLRILAFDNDETENLTTGSFIFGPTGNLLISGGLTTAGTVDIPQATNGITVNGNNILSSLGAYTLMSAPTTDGIVYLYPDGRNSSTGRAMFTTTSVTLGALAGTGTEMLTISATGILARVPMPITNVSAGNGLIGGGSASTVSLNVGEGSGISVSADAVAVDATVLRTTGNQTVGGIKTFTSVVNALNVQYDQTQITTGTVINFNSGAIQYVSLSANRTFTFSNAADGKGVQLQVQNTSASAVTIGFTGGTLPSGENGTIPGSSTAVFSMMRFNGSIKITKVIF